MLKVININREAVFCRDTCKVGDLQLKRGDKRYTVTKGTDKAWLNEYTMYWFGKTPDGEIFTLQNQYNSSPTVIFDAQGNKKFSNWFFDKAEAEKIVEEYNAEKEKERAEKEAAEKAAAEEAGDAEETTEESQVEKEVDSDEESGS